MKKLLFISNSTKPTYEQQVSRDGIKLDNVSIPSVEAAQSMGYEVFIGVNRINAKELDCDYNVTFYNASIYRNIFDFKSNYTAYKNLMTLLKKEKFDVIHCNTPIGGVLGRLCGKKAKVPKVIYTVHGFHFYEGASILNRTIFKWAEMFLAYYTDAIITINKEDYQAAQKFMSSDKVYYVPGVGVDTSLYRPGELDKRAIRNSLGLSNEDILLIAMGDLIHRKNYAVSIRAIAKADNSKLHFLICGKGPKLEELKGLAKDLNIENQIHFLGFRTDTKELQQVADIFLFTTHQEGLPRSMMEAMASGLPCVASKIRGNVDLIENSIGGYLFPPEDIDGFAKAISELAVDEGLRKTMGLKNLETIKQFDVANIKIKMKEIYKKELL
ncbi:glycosyltransferase family 4 protein [Paenibacillus sp. PL91]|uniref:glycosyltransferase family 4 protein n=1 Tax=Paenibacillus sp. PL91 TaxID=2729538 RepID=UPI00145FBB1A|nr:glycosyltransferase family 4 protein [Paenibacillus sp. PL91]MBC9202867.1 glycosyltransferase family 4 protein [Paenibacillus sp. PL91]